jgi:hypothetical protein
MKVLFAALHESGSGSAPRRRESSAAQARESNGGLVVIPDAFTIGHRAEITLLTARYRVPAVYWSRFFAEVGRPAVLRS